jgi:hypothetical protein
LVVEVLEILGIEGWFIPSDSGNNQIVGEPDFSWLQNPTLHPKVVVCMSPISVFYHTHFLVQVEYKTKWAAPLKDLPGYFQCKNACNVLEQQSIDAVHQLYGYVTFNENKYGLLSNMQYA